MKSRLAFASLLLVALVSGCQTTSIRSAWFDTDFAGPPFRKVIVVGNIDTVTDARLFEDAFVARLRAAGVEAVAGHGAIPDVERAPDLVFEAAVVNSGAQGLLLVRLLGVDVRTQVSTTMVPSGMNWGRGPWGSSWAGQPRPRPNDASRPASQAIRTCDRGDKVVRCEDKATCMGRHYQYFQSEIGGDRDAGVRRSDHRPTFRSWCHSGKIVGTTA